MSQGAVDTQATLKTLGTLVKVGTEAAARHDEIVELDALVKSPLTEVPDKINYMDSLINRNIQWGHGRTDQFWDLVFNTWKKGYHLVWLPILSNSMPPVVHFYIVSYKEQVYGVDGKERIDIRTAQIMTGTLKYLLTRTDRYSEVTIIEDRDVKRHKNEFESPNVDYVQEYQRAMDFGLEVVLKWGWQALNYNMHPDHINPAYTLVIQGTPQNPFQGGGTAASSDFTGRTPPPANVAVPPKVAH
jgi:hypothetical protein